MELRWSPTLSCSDIESGQWRALCALLRRLPDNPFWSARLRAAGIEDPGAIGSLSDFIDSVPLLEKSEIAADQRARPPWGSNYTGDPRTAVRLHQTSSTSGKVPLQWLDSPESWAWVVENWATVLDAAEIRAGDPVFFAFSFGPFLGFWAGWDAAVHRGCRALSGGAQGTRARLESILSQRAVAVCATPTYALRLGEMAREEGIDLQAGAVRALVVAGEPGGCVPSIRSRLEELWPGATVFDHYGMTEVGPVTLQVAAEPTRVYPIESSYLCELIDSDDGRRLEVGTDAVEGELVLTTLGRSASPLLRYRTGDRVRAVRRPLPGGELGSMAFEGGILDRADDMVIVRGVNLYPRAVDEQVRAVEGVAEYRVEIAEERDMAEVDLLFEAVDPAQAPNVGRQLAESLRSAFPLRIQVLAVAGGTLPRFELKARRWIRVRSPEDRIERSVLPDPGEVDSP